ncbi:hypothetical protein WJX82_007368 [Trebouxia sp. C0006]
MAQVPALTQIPKSKTNEEAVTGLLQLAHDCSAAYGQAAEKGSDAEFKQAMQKFAGQADSHIKQWRGLLNPPPEKETTISTSINSAKVKLANLGGDKGIVAAIFNNANDSATAYEAISQRSEFPKQTTSLAAKLLPEAQEQRAFLEKFAKQ